MSMLAEKRKGVSFKYKLTPRKSAWSDDANTFGKRMMEKMGWKPGDGIGANLQGMKDVLRIRQKLDNKGVGYKYNDPYCVHQTSFESVLSGLSNKDGKKLDEESTWENSEANSLELKSKQSRARVHYQKFTRGKDISNYSSKDLECILGKKVKTYESDYSSTKYPYGGNLVDYFKTKLESKSNVELTGIPNCQTVDVKLESGEHGLGFEDMKEITSAGEEVDELRERKREKRLRRAANKMESFSNNSGMVNKNIDTEKKTDKCRAKENMKIGGQGSSLNDTGIIDEILKDFDIPTKRRRKKNSTMEVEDSSEMHDSGLQVENVRQGTKRDKKRKLKEYSENLEINLKEQGIILNDCEALTIDEHFESTILPQQKKERKKSPKMKEDSEILRTGLVEDVETAASIENNREIKNCKKKKKGKQQDSDCSEHLEEISDIAEKNVKKRKAEFIGDDLPMLESQGTLCSHLQNTEIKKKKENGECQTCVQESSCSKRKKKNILSGEHVGIFEEDKISSNGEVDERKNKRKNRTKKMLAEELDEQNTIIENSLESVDDLPIYEKKWRNWDNHCNEMKTCVSTKHINVKLERRKSVTFSDKLEETFCFNTNEKVTSNAIDLEDSGDSLKIETNEVSVAKDKKKKKFLKEGQSTGNVKQCGKNSEQVYDTINIGRYFANLPCMDMTNFDFGFKGSNLGTITGYGNWSDHDDANEPPTEKVTTVENDSRPKDNSLASEDYQVAIPKKK